MSGRISDRQIAEIVEQTDMLAVVREWTPLVQAGANYKGSCPFHNEKTPSFHVHPGKKVYHCYGCGAGGNLIRFVCETRHCSFVEALEFLAARLHIDLVREAMTPAQMGQEQRERSARGRLLDLMRCAQVWFSERFEGPEGEAVRRYALVDRQLGEDVAHNFGLGASTLGDDWRGLLHHLKRHGFDEQEAIHAGLASEKNGRVFDKFRNRLMFPIQDSAGEVIAFGSRRFLPDDESAKYMNSPEITVPGTTPDSRLHTFYRKGDVVFGLKQARQSISHRKTAIVVEGNLDAMMLHQAGFTHAVATMGTAMTEAHAKVLRRFTQHVTLVFDGDKAGRAAVMKAVPKCMAAGLNGKFVMLPFDAATGEKTDPDDFIKRYGADAFQALLDRAPSLANGYLDALIAERGNSTEARAAVFQLAGPLMGAIADPMARDLAMSYLVSRLSESDGDRQVLLGHLAKVRPAAPAPEPRRPDPTFGEPEIEPLERDLAAVVIAYPALLAEAERSGVLHQLRHDGLRLALRDLAAHGRDRELTVAEVGHWLSHRPDDRARRLVNHLLLDERFTAEQVEASWQQVQARIQLRWLEEEERRVADEMKTPGLALERLQELMSQVHDVQAQQQTLRRHFAGRTRAAAR